MSAFEILLVVYGCVLAAAALGVVYRMIVGPTILDRALSSDSLVTLVVMGMALYTAYSREAWAGPAMLTLTGLAFIGTVTFARFVAREDPRQGRQRRHPQEPPTDTGPHEAIHADPIGPPTPEDGRDHRFESAPEDDPWGSEDPVDDPTHPVGAKPPPEADSAAPDRTPADGTPADGTTADNTTGVEGTRDDDRTGTDEAEDDDFATGFGAQPGSRGFEDGAGSRWPDEPTEGRR